MSDKYHDTVSASKVETDDAAVSAAVKKIISEHAGENKNTDTYKTILSCIDLTTLSSSDSPQSVSDFVERVNAFDNEHPDLPNVAAICVYPNFAPVVRTVLDVSSVKVACVSGAFPSSQSCLAGNNAETSMAIKSGAQEK